MLDKLDCIKQRAGAIQFGLMRFRENNENRTMEVKLADSDGELLSCITADNPYKRLLNKRVNLIQKYHDDYLYIAGRVTNEGQKNKKVLAVQITRACWFVKKSKGSTSWLQEKYVYDSSEAA